MIPEVVSQVAYLIIGHDYTITMAAEAGQCENILKKVLESQQRYVHISDMQSLLRLQRNH